MNKISVQKTQILIFVLSLIFVSIACNAPRNAEELEKDVGENMGWVSEDAEECYATDRDEYEYKAGMLGQTPEIPKYPESAVYEVCYIDDEVSSVRMYDGSGAEDNEQMESGETNTIIAGTYIGEPPIPTKIQEAQQNQNVSNFSIDANRVIIIVDDDGIAHGEKLLEYSYTAIGENDEPVHVTSSWKLTFAGTLLEPPYQLNATLDYHFISSERDDEATRDAIYDIQLTGNIMRGIPTEADFDTDENNLDMFVFEATKQ